MRRTFGNDALVLDDASPGIIVRQVVEEGSGERGVEEGAHGESANKGAEKRSTLPPPFLILNASTDFGLQADGETFHRTLCDNGLVSHWTRWMFPN